MNKKNIRIIAKLEIKSEWVVKPIYFEGLKKIGVPSLIGKQYYLDGVDEIIYIDIVSSLYRREISYKQIKDFSKEIYIPITAGGGVRSEEGFVKLLESGADKVAINTFALQEDPNIIDNLAKKFGSQAVTSNIEAKWVDNDWYCYTDNGRIPTNKKVLEWVKEVENRGAGEIMLQSVDRDGAQKGFDHKLIANVVNSINIPVIATSGAGSINDVKLLLKECRPSGIAFSSLLHYKLSSLIDIRNIL